VAGEDSKGVSETARESAEDVVREADRGRSERTPLIALSGVTMIVAIAVAVLVVIVFLVYYLQ
jgi:hypothetical protein